MKRKRHLYLIIILLLISLIGLTLNINNYNNQIKRKNKYKSNTVDVKEELKIAQKQLEKVENEYNKLMEDESKSKSIEDYKSWQKKNEEIKEYLK